MKKIHKVYVVFSLAGTMTMGGGGVLYSSATPDVNLIAETGNVEETTVPTVVDPQPTIEEKAEGGEQAVQNVQPQPASTEGEIQHEANFFGGQALALKRLIDEQNASPNPDQKELELLNAQYVDVMAKYNKAGKELDSAPVNAGKENEVKDDVTADDTVVGQGVGESGVSATTVEGVATEQPIAKDQVAPIPTPEAPVATASGTATEVAGEQPAANVGMLPAESSKALANTQPAAEALDGTPAPDAMDAGLLDEENEGKTTRTLTRAATFFGLKNPSANAPSSQPPPAPAPRGRSSATTSNVNTEVPVSRLSSAVTTASPRSKTEGVSGTVRQRDIVAKSLEDAADIITKEAKMEANRSDVAKTSLTRENRELPWKVPAEPDAGIPELMVGRGGGESGTPVPEGPHVKRPNLKTVGFSQDPDKDPDTNFKDIGRTRHPPAGPNAGFKPGGFNRPAVTPPEWNQWRAAGTTPIPTGVVGTRPADKGILKNPTTPPKK